MSNTPHFGWFQLHSITTDDSMAWAKKVITHNPHGTLLYADRYTHVRGRHGRTWVQMPGQLLLTYLVKPENISGIATPDAHGATPLMYLYYALSAGIHDAISSFVPECLLKWPNDCMLGSKKGAGMLLEPVWQGSQLVGVVFGVGINVNNRFDRGSEMDTIAASMRTHHMHGAYDEHEVLEKVNACLTSWFSQWQAGNFAQIWQYWQDNHLPSKTELTVHRADGSSVTGTLVAPHITGDVTLLIDNKEVTIRVEEVISLMP